jgi:hypothetical protein
MSEYKESNEQRIRETREERLQKEIAEIEAEGLGGA